ncbi:AEC family transporter [Methanococcus voltae]|uniref:Auxin Efflux Carrier n=1 Tax=Methanococcus voltae (strain ATCC BAA-1334 / A3) TaxID=456320 RepID=D7DRV4_METV3|nr:AEC family transporter [Methanococcus voltae]MCS3901389.1 auxin efflux carrier (AEC) [Methanococcus voltae]
MDIMIIIVALILVGYIAKVSKILSEDHILALNNIVIYMGIPSTIFLNVLENVRVDQLSEFLKLPILVFLMSAFCIITSYYVGKALKMSDKSLGAFILLCTLGNTSFMGYPVINGFYGAEGLTRAIFWDMGSVIVIMGLGTYIGLKMSGAKKNVALEIMKFPPIVAGVFSTLLVVLGFNLSYMPSIIVETLTYFSQATIALIMISLGLSLSPSALKFGMFYGLVASVIRLLLAPAFTFGASEFVLDNTLDRNVAVLQSGTSSAMMSLVFAIQYDLDIKMIASGCFITTVVSIGTLTALYHILNFI